MRTPAIALFAFLAGTFMGMGGHSGAFAVACVLCGMCFFSDPRGLWASVTGLVAFGLIAVGSIAFVLCATGFLIFTTKD